MYMIDLKRRAVANLRVCWVVLIGGIYGIRALGADMEVRFDFSDEGLRRDVTAVCRDVVEAAEKRVNKPPPLGIKPIIIQKAPDDTPRAVTNGLPREYIINLTCLGSRDYCRIAYQLGHELGHVYVDPQKDNWFIESVATAMSLVALSDMHAKWSHDPPFPSWRSWARHFPEYREHAVDEQLKVLGLNSSETTLKRWLRSRGPKKLGERPEQHACALIIASVLDKHPQSFGAITSLGAATSRDGHTDFRKWQSLVAPGERLLVVELARLFSPLQNR